MVRLGSERGWIGTMREKELDDILPMCEVARRKSEGKGRLRPNVVVWARFAAFEHPPHLVDVVACDCEEKRRSRRCDSMKGFSEGRRRGWTWVGRGRNYRSICFRANGELGARVGVVFVVFLVLGDRPNRFREST